MEALVRQGRRAAVWWSYVWGDKRTPYGPAGPAEGHPDWQVRLTHRRTKIYGQAVGRPHPLQKTHIVRDEIVATHRFGAEVRYTAWLCGAKTFAARLTSDRPRTVCSLCLIVHQRRSQDPMPRSV